MDNSRLNQANFINSDLNGMIIQNIDISNAVFKNSNLENLKIKNGVLDDVVIDKNSVASDELKTQIYLDTTLQPMEEYIDYINRVIKNQLIEKFGFPSENPLSDFY